MEDRINVYDCAISSDEGELRFHRFAANNRGRSCISEDGEVTVKTSRLDSIIDIKNQVLGIKIDVEGHELDVISGMKEVLKNNTCILQIESFADNLSNLEAYMEELGYLKLKTIHADHYFTNKK